MLVGLITDTHIPEMGNELPRQVYEILEAVDLILHAGDMYIIDVLDWLEKVAPVVAVRGNGDGRFDHPPFPEYDKRVKDVQVLELEGLRAGMVHAFPFHDETSPKIFNTLLDQHFSGVVDILVCGDSHSPRVEWHEGMLLVNSGSPTIHDPHRPLGTVALLNIEAGIPHTELVQL